MGQAAPVTESRPEELNGTAPSGQRRRGKAERIVCAERRFPLIRSGVPGHRVRGRPREPASGAVDHVQNLEAGTLPAPPAPPTHRPEPRSRPPCTRTGGPHSTPAGRSPFTPRRGPARSERLRRTLPSRRTREAPRFLLGPLACCALGRIRTCNLLIRSSTEIGQRGSLWPPQGASDPPRVIVGRCGCCTSLRYGSSAPRRRWSAPRAHAPAFSETQTYMGACAPPSFGKSKTAG